MGTCTRPSSKAGHPPSPRQACSISLSRRPSRRSATSRSAGSTSEPELLQVRGSHPNIVDHPRHVVIREARVQRDGYPPRVERLSVWILPRSVSEGPVDRMEVDGDVVHLDAQAALPQSI